VRGEDTPAGAVLARAVSTGPATGRSRLWRPFLRNLRPTVTSVSTPLASRLARLGVTPDMVTVVGAIGATTSALWFYGRGELVVGSIVVGVFLLLDLLDGVLARLTGTSSAWGTFLDCSMDRVVDSAVVGALAMHFIHRDPLVAGLVLYGGFAGLLISYMRARAFGLGLDAQVGVAERGERLVLLLLTMLLHGLGLPVVLVAGLGVFVVGCTVTIVQTFVAVGGQAKALGRG
jgi:CDP-diacylglycerol--glycerol-3-phosphate 3-phosphatidyltransferase